MLHGHGRIQLLHALTKPVVAPGSGNLLTGLPTPCEMKHMNRKQQIREYDNYKQQGAGIGNSTRIHTFEGSMTNVQLCILCQGYYERGTLYFAWARAHVTIFALNSSEFAALKRWCQQSAAKTFEIVLITRRRLYPKLHRAFSKTPMQPLYVTLGGFMQKAGEKNLHLWMLQREPTTSRRYPLQASSFWRHEFFFLNVIQKCHGNCVWHNCWKLSRTIATQTQDQNVALQDSTALIKSHTCESI